MVIAIPAPLVIQGDNKQVCTLEALQSFLTGPDRARRIAQDGVAKRPAQAVENGCAQQEGLDAFGLLLQDFF